jgi:hypothetical protein
MDWLGYVALGVLATLAATGPALAQYIREIRLGRAGLDHTVTDEEMRKHLGRLYWALGYRVYLAGDRHPEFDLVLVDGLRQQSGVLMRHWRARVDEAAVAAVAGTTRELGWGPATVVSVQGFTARARQAAEQGEVALWSLRELTETLDRVRQLAVAFPDPPAISPLDGQEEQLLQEARVRREAQARAAASAQAQRAPTARRRPERMRPGEGWSADGIPKCPRCGRKMVVRSAGSGSSYWGCPAYPRCLGTRPR